MQPSIASESLRLLIARELAQPADRRVMVMATAIAGRHPGARAVLFYGSCLRETRLDGLMLDFYLVVADYPRAFGPRWLATANRLVPPNVFPFAYDGLVAKYAVLSEGDFARLAGRSTRNPSVWARFAQPSRLVWSADDAATAIAIEAVAGAAPALLAAVRPCVADRLSPLDLWRHAFRLTYGAELRAERSARPMTVVEADPARYRAFTLPALAAAGIDATIEDDALVFVHAATAAQRRIAAHAWSRRRREGKALTLLRLAKASTTYAGGIDYLAWKIGRHSGVPLVLKPWQRRWPLLAALTLLPRLIARGVVR